MRKTGLMIIAFCALATSCGESPSAGKGHLGVYLLVEDDSLAKSRVRRFPLAKGLGNSGDSLSVEDVARMQIPMDQVDKVSIHQRKALNEGGRAHYEVKITFTRDVTRQLASLMSTLSGRNVALVHGDRIVTSGSGDGFYRYGVVRIPMIVDRGVAENVASGLGRAVQYVVPGEGEKIISQYEIRRPDPKEVAFRWIDSRSVVQWVVTKDTCLFVEKAGSVCSVVLRPGDFLTREHRKGGAEEKEDIYLFVSDGNHQGWLHRDAVVPWLLTLPPEWFFELLIDAEREHEKLAGIKEAPIGETGQDTTRDVSLFRQAAPLYFRSVERYERWKRDVLGAAVNGRTGD